LIGYYNRPVLVNTEAGKYGKAVDSKRRILNVSGNSAAYISGNSFGMDDFEVELTKASEIMEYILTYTQKQETKTKD